MSSVRHPGRTCLAAALMLQLSSGALADELRGVVRDSLARPIPNADFDVFDLDGNKLTASDNTDAAGIYRLILAAGRYDVLVQPPIGSGFAPHMTYSVTVAGVTTLDWILGPAFRQVGRTRDELGQPVAGTRILFDRLRDGIRTPALGDLSSVFGTFAAYIEPGSFTVTAIPPETTSLAPSRISPWSIPGPDTLKFILTRASRLSGTVRDVAGAPVAGVRFAFERVSDGVRMPAAENRTNPDGTYRARVAAGNYDVLVIPVSGSRLVAKRFRNVALTADATLDVTLEPGMLVTGLVTDRDGHAVAGADWDVADESTANGLPTPGDNTDVDGRYTLTLPAGIYRMTLSPHPESGLDQRILRNVGVHRDTVINYSYLLPHANGPSIRVLMLGSPTRTTAHARFVLTQPGRALCELFDGSGRRVRILGDGVVTAGAHDVFWDGRNRDGGKCHSGVYFLRVVSGDLRGIVRFVLLPD